MVSLVGTLEVIGLGYSVMLLRSVRRVVLKYTVSGFDYLLGTTSVQLGPCHLPIGRITLRMTCTALTLMNALVLTLCCIILYSLHSLPCMDLTAIIHTASSYVLRANRWRLHVMAFDAIYGH